MKRKSHFILFAMLSVLGSIVILDVLKFFFFALRMALEAGLLLAFFGLGVWLLIKINKNERNGTVVKVEKIK